MGIPDSGIQSVCQWTGNTICWAIGATSATQGATGLPPGLYEVYAPVEWWFKQGATSVAAVATASASTTGSRRTQAFERTLVYVNSTASNGFIAGIAGSTSVAYITPITE